MQDPNDSEDADMFARSDDSIRSDTNDGDHPRMPTMRTIRQRHALIFSSDDESDNSSVDYSDPESLPISQHAENRTSESETLLLDEDDDYDDSDDYETGSGSSFIPPFGLLQPVNIMASSDDENSSRQSSVYSVSSESEDDDDPVEASTEHNSDQRNDEANVGAVGSAVLIEETADMQSALRGNSASNILQVEATVETNNSNNESISQEPHNRTEPVVIIAPPSDVSNANPSNNAEQVASVVNEQTAVTTGASDTQHHHQPDVTNTQNDFVAQERQNPGSSKRKLSSPSASQRRQSKSARHNEHAGSDDDDGRTCPICFEAWTNSGKHRLTSLKCGHLFGYKCIDRWLKDPANRKCPQCNSKAKRSDVRVLYASKLCAIDSTELESALQLANKEMTERRNKEMELAKVRMQLSIAEEKCKTMKERLQKLPGTPVLNRALRMLEASGEIPSTSQPISAGGRASSGIPRYRHNKTVVISQAGGCRVMAFDAKALDFAISQPSPHASFMSGFGIKRLSMVDMKSAGFVMLHQKAIKDLKFCPFVANHLLSASLDGSLRITDLASNAKVHEYKCEKPVWSCCWDGSDRNLLYAGLNNGSHLQFDLRKTSEPLSTLDNPNSRCPVIALHHVAPAASSHFHGRGGLLSGTLDGVTMWQAVDDATLADFRPNILPLQPGSCCDLQFAPDTHHCLVTFRPGRSYQRTTHHLCELRRVSDGSVTSQVTCNVVESYYGGPAQRMLTRNAVYKPDADSLFVCVGDQQANKIHIYDATRGSLVQSLTCEGAPTVDHTPFHVENRPMLAALSEKSLALYDFTC